MPSSPKCVVRLIAACTLAVGLGGCVAAPLAQMAVSQMAPGKSTCTTCGSVIPDGTFAEISKGFGDSLHKLTNSALDTQTAAATAPPK